MDLSKRGKLIGELRTQKGMTQKELSELCNIDIRTVQRIECGEVEPRFSTLNLIADALEVDIDSLRTKDNGKRQATSQFYRFTAIIGIFQLLNFLLIVFWGDYNSTIHIGNAVIKTYTIFLLLHIPLGILFYRGFYVWGRHRNIKHLVLSAFILMIIIPFSEILQVLILLDVVSFSQTLATVIIVVIGLNRIIFGLGLFRIKNSFKYVAEISGILMIFTGLLYIIPVSTFQSAGNIIYLPVVILLILLLFRESKELLQHELQSENKY